MLQPNLAHKTTEEWRPLTFRIPSARGLGALPEHTRRLFDLQNGSIWRDLSVELADVKGRVLDVGCGAQPYRHLLPAGVEYQGLDELSAAEEFGYRVPDTIYFRGPVWPVETECADVVLCTETLEHVPDVPTFLAEARRALRPGGTLILTVPFAARWHYIPHDYWRFTPSGLQLVLEKAGFVAPVIHGRGNAVTVACYKVMALFHPLLMPQSGGLLTRLLLQAIGIVLSPPFLLCALVGRISLSFKAGDDCLGYTVRCSRPRA